MKTTKLTAVALALAFAATAAMAQTESPAETAPGAEPQSITIMFKKALQDRGLVYAMRTQLNPRFLLVDKPVYTVSVRLKRGVAYITGTQKEWQGFFSIEEDNAPKLADARRIHLKQALLDTRLVRAMHQQLTPALLRDDKPVYTAAVKYNHSTVYVFATAKEWTWFFHVDDNNDHPGS